MRQYVSDDGDRVRWNRERIGGGVNAGSEHCCLSHVTYPRYRMVAVFSGVTSGRVEFTRSARLARRRVPDREERRRSLSLFDAECGPR